jgi:NADPH:quinone reductase-like Zn-dependent oxidoreductase
MVASLPVTGLTPYHALKEASLKTNEYLLVFGASRNTGTVAVHIVKKMGAKIITVSKNEWERDFGADYIIKDCDKVDEQVMILLKVK